MKYLIKLLLAFFVLNTSIRAELFQDAGTEFWFCFNQNYLNIQEEIQHLQLKAIIVPTADTKISFTEFRTGETKEYFIKRDSLFIIEIDKENQITTYEKPIKNSFKIKSEKPVLVWATNQLPQTADSYTVLPSEMLGKDYFAMGYQNMSSLALFSQLTVLATEDKTEITIIPTTFTGGVKPMFQPINITLNMGETYSIFSISPAQELEGMPQQEITGTIIKANKNIAVLSGHQCTFIPREINACDYLVEQLLPTKFWGNDFFLGSIEKRTKFTYRALALENGTDIRKNSKWVANINAGQTFDDVYIGDFLHIESSAPTLLMQYTHGYMDTDSIGDPTMMLIRPVSHYRKNYTIATPFDDKWYHFVNIYVPTKSLDNLLHNGQKVGANLFKAVHKTDYSVGSIELKYGVHQLECDTPFGISSYGHSKVPLEFSSYGHR